MRNIGIDISKKKCIVCVMNCRGKMLEEITYDNTLADAKEFAGRIKREYGKKGRCRVACKSRFKFKVWTTPIIRHKFIIVTVCATQTKKFRWYEA